MTKQTELPWSSEIPTEVGWYAVKFDVDDLINNIYYNGAYDLTKDYGELTTKWLPVNFDKPGWKSTPNEVMGKLWKQHDEAHETSKGNLNNYKAFANGVRLAIDIIRNHEVK